MPLAQLLTTPMNIDVGDKSYRGQTPADVLQAGVTEAALLPAVRAYLTGRIDETAEALRGRVLTPGSGQAMEYQEVRAQALAALSAKTPKAEDYPMLAATVGIDTDPSTGAPATDFLGVARSASAAYAAWTAIGAAIRTARLRGKAAVEAAPTIEAAAAAFDVVEWPALPA